MIRYQITKQALEDLVKAESADWLTRAAERTKGFKELGFYKESSSIWSEVKPVYMRLQQGKCAYCEREMEPVDFGKVEQDVEHFRPKGNIREWKAPKKLKDAGIQFTAVPNSDKGYFLLPYNLFNYAAACKPCNSTLKKDYFPIAGTHNIDADDPAILSAEQAYLLFPIGSLDDDPETVIEFFGPSPRPVEQNGFKRNRALVTIEFFKLDDAEKRKNLYRGRALIIMAMFPLLKETKTGTAAKRAAARATVAGFLKPGLQHLNCAKSFKRLFDKDANEAKSVFDKCVELITSIS